MAYGEYSPVKAKVFGALCIVGSIPLAYATMYRPLAEAHRTGTLHYYMKGVLLPPAFLYLGVLAMFVDIRDGQWRTVGANGKATLTRKGWWVFGGLMVVLGLTIAVWEWYLHVLGFTEAL